MSAIEHRLVYFTGSASRSIKLSPQTVSDHLKSWRDECGSEPWFVGSVLARIATILATLRSRRRERTSPDILFDRFWMRMIITEIVGAF